MSQPNEPAPAPAPQGSDAAVPAKKVKKIKDDSGGGGGLGGIVALIPPALVYLAESKRRDSIDNNIPHLIRDIADAGRSGMTLTRSIEISSERDYGPLTKELKKLIAKISFRVPLERALQYFA